MIRGLLFASSGLRQRGGLLVSALLLATPTVTFTATPAAPGSVCIETAQDCGRVPSAGKKWHPGHYMQVMRGTADAVQSTRFRYYDQIASNTNITGVGVFFRWAQLEAARGDYSAGIALVRAELNKLKGLAAPKRLAIRIRDEAWGETCPGSGTFPAYLQSAGKLFTTKSQCIWKRWDPEAMGWFINMLNAYAAQFDREAYVEIISPFHETSIGWGGSTRPAGYSDAALDQQYRRLANALAASWKRTNIWIPSNHGLNETMMAGYVAHLSSLSIGTGNPDTCPTCNMSIDGIVRGVIGGHDYRGEIFNSMSVEASELGYDSVGPDGGFTAQQIFDYANGTQRVNHLFWDRNVSTGTTQQRWDTGILPLINSRPLTNTSCPKSYSSGCAR